MKIFGFGAFYFIAALSIAGTISLREQDKLVEQKLASTYSISEGSTLYFENTEFKVKEINGEYMWVSWYDEYGEHNRPVHFSEILMRFKNETRQELLNPEAAPYE